MEGRRGGGDSHLGDGQTWVQALGASPCTVHDGVTPVDGHLIVEGGLPLLSELITGVRDPPVALHKDGGAEVLARVPPVGGTRSRAARAQNALVHSVELLAVGDALDVLLHRCGSILALQIRLDRLVLLVELREIGHEVLHHVRVRERVDLGGGGSVGFDTA